MTSHAPPLPTETSREKKEKTTPAARLGKALILGAKCAIAAALLWWLLKTGRFDWRVFADLKLTWALAGVLCFQGAMLFCIALRWHFLARTFHLDLSFRQTLRISLIGYYAAILTPASLGLDGARLLLARQLRPKQGREIVASVLWDRVLGLWSLLIISAVGGAVLMILKTLAPYEIAQRAVSIAAIACGVLALLIGALVGNPQCSAALAGIPFLQKRFGAVQPPPRAIFGLPLFLAFATHLCNLLATFCALRIFAPNVPLLLVLLVTPFLILSSLVPLTPLGLGVTDATASLLFATIGVGIGGAAATMLLRAFFVLLSLVCGLAWLWPIDISDPEPKFPSPSPPSPSPSPSPSPPPP